MGLLSPRFLKSRGFEGEIRYVHFKYGALFKSRSGNIFCVLKSMRWACLRSFLKKRDGYIVDSGSSGGGRSLLSSLETHCLSCQVA